MYIICYVFTLECFALALMGLIVFAACVFQASSTALQQSVSQRNKPIPQGTDTLAIIGNSVGTSLTFNVHLPVVFAVITIIIPRTISMWRQPYVRVHYGSSVRNSCSTG